MYKSLLEYEDEEIESLEYYTSRKSHGYLDYEEINEFLRYLFKPSADVMWRYTDSAKLKEMICSIKKLYSLSCKYGTTHSIPKRIYRQEYHYENILSHKNSKSNKWIAESFLSFSKYREETEQFEVDGHSKLVIATAKDDDIQRRSIPFIDVTDILGMDSYYLRDEGEILIPPFITTEIPAYITHEYEGEYKINLLAQNHTDVADNKINSLDNDLQTFIQVSQQYDYSTNSITKLNKIRRKLKDSLAIELTKIKSKIMLEVPIGNDTDTKNNNLKNEIWER